MEYNEKDLNYLNDIIKSVLNIIDCKNNIDVNISRDTYKIIKKYRKNIQNNSLEHKYPEISKMWDYDKNDNLSPSAVFPTSIIKYWWKCPTCGVSFKASAGHMTGRNVKTCPNCSRKRINRKNTIRILNIDLNIIYNSLTEAAKSVNGRKGDICDCCNGNKKTAFGYHWRYLDENERRNSNIKGKIKNTDTGIIYNNSIEAAKSCNGDSRTINRCCRGVVNTAYGYHWEVVK